MTSTQEQNLGRSAAEYTSRAQRFMAMARQMGNVMIDYDIYLASLKLLLEINGLLKGSDPPGGISDEQWREANLELDTNVFEQAYGGYELLRRYGQLYEQRAMIGNQEVSCPGRLS